MPTLTQGGATPGRAAVSRSAPGSASGSAGGRPTGGVAPERRIPQFSERVREQLLLRRILAARRGARRRQRHVAHRATAHARRRGPRRRRRAVDQLPRRSVPSMLAIRDVMRLVPCDVSTLALGLACSAGSSCCRPVPRAVGSRSRTPAHPDAPGLGRDRRQHRRHRGPGRRPAAHGRGRARPDRRGYRPAGRAHLRRTRCVDHWYTAAEAPSSASSTGSSTRSARSCRPKGTVSGCRRGRASSSYTDPQRHRPAPAGRADHGRLLAPAHQTHRHRDRFRRGQHAHRPAAAPRGGQRRPGDQPVHQLRGR